MAAQVFRLLGLYFKIAKPVADKQAEHVQSTSDSLISEGHSKVCAGAHALDEMCLLDGDIGTVIRMGGGCPKCGI